MLLALSCACDAVAQQRAATPRTSADIIAASRSDEWRALDLANTLVMSFGSDKVAIIELAPRFAPETTANILTLVRQRYFDGLAVVRVQDNFVTQWGDPNSEEAVAALNASGALVGGGAKSLGAAKTSIRAEFWRQRAASVPFVRLPDPDGYVPEVGHSGGFPAARDNKSMWLTHCYGMVGAGRGDTVDSGTGAELYVVIGHAPRQLDRNITVVGRVVQGMEHLASLPRGTGTLGFYEEARQRTPIASVRIASDLPSGGAAGRLEALRTDSASFTALVEARRNRRDDWYKVPAGHIDVCSVLLPVRTRS